MPEPGCVINQLTGDGCDDCPLVSKYLTAVSDALPRQTPTIRVPLLTACAPSFFAYCRSVIITYASGAVPFKSKPILS